ncbi:glucosaminidase domain-containing protein [Patescibacteria group bacterium]|nr:glucosaminidase domain-containing protein [Patescibacteria group bacterium]
MKKILFMIMIALVAIFFLSQPVLAQEKIAGSSAVLENSLPLVDKRVIKLKKFLENYDSPLAEYADEFVETADKYGLDWKLVPAITGVESTFGKQIPAGSYNAYGWANGAFYFQSWEQSIDLVSQTLKEKYINRGLNTPYKMGPVYAPPSKTWAWKVTSFMNKLDCFAEFGCFEALDFTI